MFNGFFRVIAASPKVSVADCKENVRNIVEILKDTAPKKVSLITFPEMSVTGYTCADLFHNTNLIKASYVALRQIANETRAIGINSAIVVGAPIVYGNALYNCAVVMKNGRILAVVPKTYLPNYNEFYEKRWWQPAPDFKSTLKVKYFEEIIPFGTRQIVEVDDVKIGFDICEDLWSPIPPSSFAALAGAEVIVNLSASDDLIGKYDYLKALISQQSARCLCGYVYASAGYGESSTDLVFDGKTIIAENGTILECNKRWQSGNQYVVADIDIDALRHDRMHIGTFNDCAARMDVSDFSVVKSSESTYNFNTVKDKTLYRYINPAPFVPASDADMIARCEEITNIQTAGLAKRLDFIHCSKLVVGISGGLDSTLALLIAVKAFDRLKLDRKGIIGITMPGFGTTDRTHDNAILLMEKLGITIKEIPIGPAVTQHFNDIGHNPDIHDVTYENSQARERTQILMDVANQLGGIVLGTGDLSELALGWATYNGDHMSMYGVNAGVPKTLVKYLVRFFADDSDIDCSQVLSDILDTPISPELIPADEKGQIVQKTEDLVGPYELHDFFLYYTLRYGFSNERILFLAEKAFKDKYTGEEIEKWLKVFVKRFFQQQFKRSCLPDGPKVGSVCLSPRGDWRMPSDAVAFGVKLPQVDAPLMF